MEFFDDCIIVLRLWGKVKKIQLLNYFFIIKMQHKIGTIVKWKSVEWMVIATKQQPLTLEYLNGLAEADLMVEKIKELASVGVHVLPGFDYRIVKILDRNKHGSLVLDNHTLMESCFEGDI